jgi:hypothetical protein
VIILTISSILVALLKSSKWTKFTTKLISVSQTVPGRSCGSKGAEIGDTGVSPVVGVMGNSISLHARGGSTLAGANLQLWGGGKTTGAGKSVWANRERQESDAMGPNTNHLIIPRD